MSEFQQATRLWAGKLGLHVTQYRNGKWGFVGSVPVSLSYERRDGNPLTDEDIDGIRRCGAGIFRATIASRVWETKDAAIASATALGCEVIL